MLESKLNSNKLLWNIIRYISSIAVLAMVFISILVYKVDFISLLVFFFFLAVYVQIPGIALLKYIKVKLNHTSSKFLVSFFIGWTFVIIQYFITELIGTDIVLYIAGPIATFIYTYKTVKSPQRRFLINKIKFSKISVSFCIMTVLVMLYAFLCVQYIYLHPSVADFTYFNPDKGYHMGLINALANGYPVHSPWVSGKIINYHFFTEMLYSVALRLFHLRSDFLIMSAAPYMTTYTVCLSLYALFREFSSKPARAGIYSLLIILSNVWLLQNSKESVAFKFFIINDNNSGHALACVIAFIIISKYFWSTYKNQNSFHGLKNQIFLLTLFIMLITGIKGPFGMVLIAGLWGSLFLGLILRQEKLSSAIPLIAWTFGFLLIYVFVLGSKGQSNGGGTSILALGKISNIFFLKAPIVEFAKNLGAHRIATYLILIICFFSMMFTTYFIPLCIGYIREFFLVISKRKKYDFIRVSIYASTLVGIIATILLNYSGHSQIYFGFLPVIFASLISYWLFEDIENSKSNNHKYKFSKNALCAIFIVTLIPAMLSLTASYNQFISLAASHSNVHENYWDTYHTITKYEYDAMDWVYNNTHRDSLLAVDRYYSVSPDKFDYKNRWHSRFFLYSVFADRNCYVGGSGYNLKSDEFPLRHKLLEENARLFNPDNLKRGTDARSLGVDYVVVSKRFNNVRNLENDDYKKCFSNRDIDIYEVRKNSNTTNTSKNSKANSSEKMENAAVIPIFTYHNVCEPRSEDKHLDEHKSSVFIPADILESQLKYLSDNGYNTISVKEFYQWYKGEIELPRKSVMIIFDDGDYSVAKFAYPILKKYKQKSTIFMIGTETPDITDTNMTAKGNYLAIGKDLIAEIKKEYPDFAFENHTYDLHHTAPNGQRAMLAASDMEVVSDLSKMHEEFGYTFLAYPFGVTDDRIKSLLPQTGVQMAFGYGENDFAGRSNDIYEIPRIKVSSHDPDDFYKWLIP